MNTFPIDMLKLFLVDAKKATYASGDNAQKKKEPDGSTTLVYTQNNLMYHDNYFGGEPYGGREVVFCDNQIIYIMTYYGYIYPTFHQVKDVYAILQQALMFIPSDHPYRGPAEYISGEYTYINIYTGNLAQFSGEEHIYYQGNKVYTANYMGGAVDIKT